MIMNESKKLSANAVGGKTARACDSCLRRRARWYCPADDAFLCQACDSSVHSANQLASRHERVRLETASFKVDPEISQTSPPSWHQGFTKKARTPRTHNKPEIKMVNHNCPLPPLVPEIGNEFEEDQEANMNIEDDHLLYRVPEFDPFAVEFCDLLTSNDGVDLVQSEEMVIMNDMAVDSYNTKEETCQDQLGLLTSDMNISEFGVDVESLLGLEENPPVVKKETFDHEFGNWDFEFDQSLMIGDEEEVKKEKLGVVVAESGVDMAMSSEELEKKEMKRSVSLRLNYEAVITAWASQRSPWTTGCRPELITDGCWPDCMGTCPKHANSPYRGLPRSGGGDGDREARVMRYKEKRRTRLFSKKIRYEVRKLNAEKRPRMKGRFVKRTTLMGTSFPNYLNN